MSQGNQQTKERPRIITLFCYILWFATFILGAFGLLGLLGFFPQEVNTVQQSPRFAFFLLVLIGLIFAFIVIGVWRMNKWAMILCLLTLGAVQVDQFVSSLGNQPDSILREAFDLLVTIYLGAVLWKAMTRPESSL